MNKIECENYEQKKDIFNETIITWLSVGCTVIFTLIYFSKGFQISSLLFFIPLVVLIILRMVRKDMQASNLLLGTIAGGLVSILTQFINK